MGREKLTKFRRVLLEYKKIGLDSMCFLYQFADHQEFGPLTHLIYQLLEENKIQAVTSAVTIVETFVQIEKSSDQLLILEYEKFFTGLPNFELVELNWPQARLAAKLRAVYSFLKTPDAIQIASVLLRGCTAFLTNDRKLLKVKAIKILLLGDFISR